MANAKAAANFRNSTLSGKQPALPPKCPFPIVSSSCGEHGSIGSKVISKPRDGQRHHQRTTSETFVIDEQPSWLDDLLNEPETPVKRGAHRRSSSDSFAYLDGANSFSNLDFIAQEEYSQKRIGSLSGSPLWGLQDFDNANGKNSSFCSMDNSFGKPQPRGWESRINAISYSKNVPQARDNVSNVGQSRVLVEVLSHNAESKEKQEFTLDSKDNSENMDGVQSKHSEVDQKRVKQQFAQRSRVRKLQYIAELEKTVQSLQAEGLEASAEVEFLDRQNLILNLENKTLRQRLDSLAQEQLIKHLQQEMLEQEITRLKMLHQQQQQPQQVTNLRRTSSKDLDSQFSGLSLKHKDSNNGCDTVSASLRI